MTARPPLVYASRAKPNPEYLRREAAGISSRDRYRVPLELEQCYAHAREYWAGKNDDYVTTGRANNPPAWRGAIDALLAFCDHVPTTAPAAPLDVRVESAAVALEVCPVFAAMPYWLAKHGPAFGLEALVGSYAIASYARHHGYLDRVGTWIVDEPNDPEYAATAWHLLRGALAGVPVPEYDHALATARRLAPHAPADVGGWIAFAFPDEPDLAADASVRVTPPTKRKKFSWEALARLATVAPLADVERLAACNVAVTVDDIATIIDRHGPAAAPAIAAVTGAAARRPDRIAFGKLLATIGTAEAKRLHAQLVTARRIPK